jgi:hypothetical protein
MRTERHWRPYPVDPSCVLYLPFYKYGAEQQKIWDVSGNNNHGTIYGATPGELGWSFDSTDDYVRLSDSESLRPSSISFLAWVRGNQWTNTYNSVVSKEETQKGYTLLVKSNGLLAVYIQLDGGAEISYNGTGLYALNTGIWYCLAFTYDGSTLRGYVNAELDKQVTGGTAIVHSTNVLYIGMSYFTSRNFNGLIDEVRIWNRALSAIEVRNNYELTRARYGV